MAANSIILASPEIRGQASQLWRWCKDQTLGSEPHQVWMDATYIIIRHRLIQSLRVQMEMHLPTVERPRNSAHVMQNRMHSRQMSDRRVCNFGIGKRPKYPSSRGRLLNRSARQSTIRSTTATKRALSLEQVLFCISGITGP